jgi:hypothetical protein
MAVIRRTVLKIKKPGVINYEKAMMNKQQIFLP